MMRSYDATSLAVVLATILAILALIVWSARDVERRLRRWADEQGLTIVSQRLARFWRGPFFWKSTRTDYVYRLTVRDSDGRLAEGWARLPGLAVGPFGRWVQVRWVDKAPATSGLLD
ncbi:hypothetical protein [Paludisphaera mucosa]|uniref:DUF3301 domain-containing protein n=1 Tax=Paludisphaera mucosa TaxID=3030827 RepID=A0ABT6F452_9BACT|nr:hypothetical protein [Paludisphaera mucosa]MDG3002276.1 hypothetical protein [Paludisphaera mucosa]